MARPDSAEVDGSVLDDKQRTLESLAQPYRAFDRNIVDTLNHVHATEHPMAALDRVLDLLFKPAVSQEHSTRAVFQTLFRTLVDSLRVDFVCLRAQDEAQNTAIEVIERAGTDGNARETEELRRWLHRSLSTNAGTRAQSESSEVSCRETFQFQFTVGRIRAIFLAGVARTDFPTPAEQLILNIAARKLIRDLGEQSYEQRQIALPALEQLAARLGARLEFFEPAPANRETVPAERIHRSRSKKRVTGMPDWRLRELFDLIPIMAWSSFPDGTCEFLNRVHYEYTGISPAQSQTWGWQMAIHPKDLAHRMEKWHESIASGRPSETEVRIRRYDGVYRWFLLRIEPFNDQFGTVVRWYGVATDIEDRKRAEEKWAASEKHLSLIINTVPMLIWSSLPDGHADFFNEQWYNYTALSPSRSDGWGWAVALHPDDFCRVTQYWRTVISTDDHGDSGFEARFRRHDGIYRWFWVRANAMRDDVGVIKRWYVTSTDIHDRKMAEDGGRRSAALLAEAQRLGGLGTFLWRVGSDTMTWCNTLYKMFGLDPGTQITRSLIEQRTHPDDSPFLFDQIKEDRGHSGNFEEQIRVLRPDGSVRYLHYCAYATTALTGEAEYVGTVQDITERHLASEALAKARAELAQAARASSLGVLTASIAHEVNQPLAGIVTNANTCLRMLNSDPPNVAGAIETARRTIRDGRRAADVISRLRNLFSQNEINSSWWDLTAATREVVELVQGELRRNRITLEEKYDLRLPLVNGDRIQLQQVILNLVRNAIDAVMGNVDEPRNIIVDASYQQDCAYLRIVDSGTGFDATVAERIFEEFFTTKKDGMGIGLSVSRWIVEAHGGTLSAARNETRGATFGFSIPFRALRSGRQ